MGNLAVDPKVLIKSKWGQQYAKQNKGEFIDIWPLHTVWSCVIFNILLGLFKRLSWLVNTWLEEQDWKASEKIWNRSI